MTTILGSTMPSSAGVSPTSARRASLEDLDAVFVHGLLVARERNAVLAQVAFLAGFIDKGARDSTRV